MSFEKFFRGLALAIAGYVIFISLVFAANASVYVFVTSDKEKVKQIVANSNTYDDVVPALLEQSRNNLENEHANKKNLLEDKEIEALATQAFDERFIRSSSESVIDGMYDWLNGKTTTPEFSINIEQPKQKFINSASQHSFNKTQKLPDCTYQQLANAKEIDIFDPPCNPPGLSQKAIATELSKELSSQNSSLLAKDQITEEDLMGNEGKPLFNDLGEVSGAFNLTKFLLWVLIFMALIFSAIMIFVSSKRSAGLKKVGISFTLTAIFIALTPIAIDKTLTEIFRAGNQPVISKGVLSPLLHHFNDAVAHIYYIFAGVVAAIGIVLIISAIKFKSKLDKTQDSASH